jgi:hypothetical protein
MKPLRWHRVRPGFYTAGPWIVQRYPGMHLAVWELRKGGLPEQHIGNFGTAAAAKFWAVELEGRGQ